MSSLTPGHPTECGVVGNGVDDAAGGPGGEPPALGIEEQRRVGLGVGPVGGIVKLTLIMIYFAEANTRCQPLGDHDRRSHGGRGTTERKVAVNGVTAGHRDALEMMFSPHHRRAHPRHLELTSVDASTFSTTATFRSVVPSDRNFI